jgi:low temperature requirement protein LtrA
MESGDSYEQRATPLELFLELVFVFALTTRRR